MNNFKDFFVGLITLHLTKGVLYFVGTLFAIQIIFGTFFDIILDVIVFFVLMAVINLKVHKNEKDL